jgi:hypothetical protein
MGWTSKRRAKPKLESRYRSRFEARVAEGLEAHGVPYEYETFKVEYEVPARRAKYLPDFRLPNNIIVEAKGRFEAKDRAKHLWIKAQNPELDIRFCFQNASNRLYRGSPTTYSMWCERYGFKYCEKQIPTDWINENARTECIAASPKGAAPS